MQRWRLAVVRQVVCDEAEVAGEIRALEQVPPLGAVATRGVLKQHGDALPRLLEVNPTVTA
jgi:hypothetical protein